MNILIKYTLASVSIIIFNCAFLLCCDKVNNIHDSKGTNCWGCNMNLEVTSKNVNLGKFYTGEIVSLPTPEGSGNQLEFTFTGDSRLNYNFSYAMDLIYDMHPGNATITKWTWEKADNSTNGIYSMPENSKIDNYTNVILFQPDGQSHCQAFAKFRMTAKELMISPNAHYGQIRFNISVTVTPII